MSASPALGESSEAVSALALTRARPRARFGPIWAASAALIFLAMVAWTTVIPIFGGPDEPAQMVRAASVVRGQWLGPHMKGQPAATVLVKLPVRLGRPTISPPCFATHGLVPAGCKPPCWSHTPPPPHCPSPYPVSHGTITVPTYVGRYPPPYYLAVGWPSLLAPDRFGIYLMRLASGALNAALLGLAVASAAVFGRGRIWAAGLALAITPTVMSVGAVINPSGMEISAAIAAWTTGLLLIWDSGKRVPPVLVRSLGVSSAVLGVARAPSPLWVALLGLFLVVFATAERRRRLLRSAVVRRYMLLVILACVAEVAWAIGARATAITPVAAKPPASDSFGQVVVAAMGHVGFLVTEMIGITGWTDALMPAFVYLLWLGGLGAVGVLAWSLGSRRHRLAIVACIAMTTVVPTAMIVSHARTDGIFMQGRDMLPIAVSVPLVLAAALSSARSGPAGQELGAPLVDKVTVTVLWITALSMMTSFAAFYRRFAVGLNGPLDFFTHVKNGWQPPVPGTLLFLAFILLSIALAQWLAKVAPGEGWGPSVLPPSVRGLLRRSPPWPG